MTLFRSSLTLLGQAYVFSQLSDKTEFGTWAYAHDLTIKGRLMLCYSLANEIEHECNDFLLKYYSSFAR